MLNDRPSAAAELQAVNAKRLLLQSSTTTALTASAAATNAATAATAAAYTGKTRTNCLKLGRQRSTSSTRIPAHLHSRPLLMCATPSDTSDFAQVNTFCHLCLVIAAFC